MKFHLIVIAFLGLSLASCSSKKTDFSKLQERNGVIFLINSDKPFTGIVVNFNNGKLEFEGSIKGGLRDGTWTYYFPNGQKNFEGVFKDGVKEGKWSFWKENGQEDEFEMYKYGKLINGTGHKSDSAKVDTSKVSEKEKNKQPSSNQNGAFVNWEKLKGSSAKTYNGVLYTGGFIKYASYGKSLVGYYRNGERTGRWIYYDKDGKVKEIKNY
ncbi:MAG: hypothetical protein HGB12_01325 [Bacteroidetes bacterium]|nr:hypothetical protein [Bacteroidota bacterium]